MANPLTNSGDAVLVAYQAILCVVQEARQGCGNSSRDRGSTNR